MTQAGQRAKHDVTGWNWFDAPTKPRVLIPAIPVAMDLIDPPFDPRPFSIDEVLAIHAWRRHGRPDVFDSAELWAFVERDSAAPYMTGKPR